MYRNNSFRRAQFMNYLDWYMFLHRRYYIQRFHICQSIKSGLEEYHVISWLYYVTDHNVRHLDLEIVVQEESNFTLSYSFSLPNMETLTTKFCNGMVKIPPSIATFSKLQYLKLHSIQISESSREWISSLWQLKKLHVRNFH